MADPFEFDLEAMFDAPPTFADEDAFAQSVERALRRRWLVRRLALAGAGVVGAAVALSRLPDLLAADVTGAAPWLGELGRLLAQPYGSTAISMAVGLAAAAVVLLRNVEV